ncbi:MAG: ATP synthase F0 subunit B [Thermodesulfobacteriota bacterium]|nr:ATP synthase F0 subunit B [Thermodesulfobacteriota bacterium]
MKSVRFINKHCKIIFSAAGMLLFMAVNVALASSGGGHEAADPKGWVATDTYRVLNFVVLAGALFYVARKPVKEFFSSRIKGIKEELEVLEQKKADAKKSLAEYADKMANLDRESEKIVADYVKQGEDAKKRILVEAEEQAVKLEESAKRNIEQEFKSAKIALQQEIAEKALGQAEILVKKSISSEDQERLVDEYLKKVVA